MYTHYRQYIQYEVYAVYDDALALTGFHNASHKPDCHYCTCITIMMFLLISMALLILQVIHVIHKYIYYDEIQVEQIMLSIILLTSLLTHLPSYGTRIIMMLIIFLTMLLIRQYMRH